MMRCRALPAGLLWVLLPGCLAPTWGVLPGDGFTDVPLDTTIVLDAGTPLDDAPPLAPAIALTRNGGVEVPIDVGWRAADPTRLRIIPRDPLPEDAVLTLTVSEAPAGPHFADARVRTLPAPRTVVFETRTREPVVLHAARCAPDCPGGRSGPSCGVLLTSAIAFGPDIRLVDRPDLPLGVRWERDDLQPRLWTTLDPLPAESEGPIEFRVSGDDWQPLPCDAAQGERALDAAFGRSSLQ